MQALSISGQMYLAGNAAMEVSVAGKPVSVGLSGSTASLWSFGGNPRTAISAFGLQTTSSAAPYISLLDGLIVFDLSLAASASTSLLMDVKSESVWTVALKSTLQINAGNMIGQVLPGIPKEVQDTLSTLFNVNPIQEVSFYASGVDKWWGLSMVVAGPLGISQLLGEFLLGRLKMRRCTPAEGTRGCTRGFSSRLPTSHALPMRAGTVDWIARVAGFPIASSFTPRLSIAGPLSRRGLPIKLGIDYSEGSVTSASQTKWLYMCSANRDCPASFQCQAGAICAKFGCSGKKILVGGLCCEFVAHRALFSAIPPPSSSS